MKQSYTTSEAAEICRVSRGTILRWIREKKLKASVTFGGHHRIEAVDLTGVLEKLGMKLPDSFSAFSRCLPSRVLLVDEEEEIGKLARHYLQKYYPALQIEEAADSFSAGITIQKYRPDLIVLNIMPPGIQGYDLCESIRNLSREYRPAILAITAHENNWEHRILEAGADLCLKKPFHENDFISAIRILWNSTYKNKRAG
ncbi:MAG: response regulator [Candidatus Omnitrophica bacterium]|nr:response regulator [Candidatus Omnitrophota bacterium]